MFEFKKGDVGSTSAGIGVEGVKIWVVVGVHVDDGTVIESPIFLLVVGSANSALECRF